MCIESSTFAQQEIFILHFLTESAVSVIPCKVNNVPFAVLHLNAVPSVADIRIGVEVSENSDTRDVLPVADYLESLSIPLADNAGLNESTDSGASEFSVQIIVSEVSYIIVDTLELFISCFARNREAV